MLTEIKFSKQTWTSKHLAFECNLPKLLRQHQSIRFEQLKNPEKRTKGQQPLSEVRGSNMRYYLVQP